MNRRLEPLQTNPTYTRNAASAIGASKSGLKDISKNESAVGETDESVKERDVQL
jgi:hypothetical protein